MIGNEEVRYFYNHLRVSFNDDPPTQEDLVDEILDISKRKQTLKRFPELEITGSDVECIKAFYEEHASVRQPQSVGLSLQEASNENSKWYVAPKNQPDSYWYRFYEWMKYNSSLSKDALETLDTNTTTIMSHLGNPKSSQFSVHGLVLGDVQSGKTGTYSALINKAIDAGYRVIIVLSGLLESLRIQTQERMEAAVTGIPTPAVKNGECANKIGCGNYGSCVKPNPQMLTARWFDFSLKQHSTKLSDDQVFVCVTKKNKSVLQNIHKWFVDYANPSNGKKIENEALLLIDDEADNASINVKKNPKETPAEINRLIRSILASFKKFSYVGFTATPYANIFINPEVADDELAKADLFPRDFIEYIKPPTSYIGAKRIFGKGGDQRHQVRIIDDIEDYLPVKHKSDVDVSQCELPESLKAAIRTFAIVTAIRNCKGGLDSCVHRSMLINVSRFVKVQHQVKDVVERFFYTRIKSPVEVNAENPRALRVPDILQLKAIFDEKYAAGCAFSWDEVFKMMSARIGETEIIVYNSKEKSSLVFDDKKPRTVIVVGGLAVSRGITLSGLSTTYLSRNTKMYDALLQMGRWFGYRNGYFDLCTIWMSEAARRWYQRVTEAHLELVDDLIHMSYLKRTPADFGLRVRQDDMTLLVTALNKMRMSWVIQGNFNVLGKVVNFPLLSREIEVNRKNRERVDAFLADCHCCKDQAHPPANVYFDVPASNILQFLKEYQVADISAEKEQYKQFLNVISSLALNDTRYAFWTVAVVKLADGTLLKGRKAEFRDNVIKVGAKSAHFSEKNYGLVGLSEEDIKFLGEIKNEKACFDGRVKRTPLLTLYPMYFKPHQGNENEWSEEEKCAYGKNGHAGPVYGVVLSFPALTNVPEGIGTFDKKYRVNAIYHEEMLSDESVDDYEDVDEGEV